MRTPSYCIQLARQIDAALKSAESHAHKEGFAIYPFLFGYLQGDCSPEEIAAFDMRIARLSRGFPPSEPG